jgi:hypothetical protein
MPASSVIDVMRLQEVITSIIAIMGGIAMACKTLAELWKKVRLEPARASHSCIIACLCWCLAPSFVRRQVLKKKPNVVPITHNLKVVVAGAQMTSDSVAKEE